MIEDINKLQINKKLKHNVSQKTSISEENTNDDTNDQEPEAGIESSADENGESDSEPTDISPSDTDNDRDSDLDFSMYDRPGRTKKSSRNRGARSNRHNIVKQPKISKRRQTNALIDTDNNMLLDGCEENLQEKSYKKRTKTKYVKKSQQQKTIKIKTKSILKSSNKFGKIETMANKIDNKDEILMANIEFDSPSKQTTILTTNNTPIESIKQLPPTTPPTPTPKKEKKPPPAHVEALIMNDMSSLFSSPDIIKKVGSDIKTSLMGDLKYNSPITVTTPPIANPLQPTTSTSKGYFMALTPNSGNIKNRQQLPSQISIRTHNPTNINQQHATITPTNNTTSEQLDLIDSIVQERLNSKTPPASRSSINEDIPNIVKMLENPNALITSVINLNTSIATTATNPSTSITPTSSSSSLQYTTNLITNVAPLLDDIDLLDSCLPTDDGLTEDLLQHVAKLVEDKNVQEVIDQQVLFGSNNNNNSTAQIIPMNTITKTTSQTNSLVNTIMNSNNIQFTSNNMLKKSDEIVMKHLELYKNESIKNTSTISNIPLTPSSSSLQSPAESQSQYTTPIRVNKEPIKIVRSDGRVITLPPIEAPTTRGAKRRAQNKPNDNNATPKGHATLNQSLSNENSNSNTSLNLIDNEKLSKEIKEQKSSISHKKIVEQSKYKPAVSVEGIPQTTKKESNAVGITTVGGNNDYDDDDDDVDSDGNSEDDPYR